MSSPHVGRKLRQRLEHIEGAAVELNRLISDLRRRLAKKERTVSMQRMELEKTEKREAELVARLEAALSRIEEIEAELEESGAPVAD